MFAKLLILWLGSGLFACKARRDNALSEVSISESDLQQYLRNKSLERIEPYLNQFYNDPLPFDLSDKNGSFFGSIISLPPNSDFTALVLYSERESMHDLVLDPEHITRQGVAEGKVAGKCLFNVISGKGNSRLDAWSVHSYLKQTWGWVSDWNVGRTNSLVLKKFSGHVLLINQEASTQFVMVITYFPTSLTIAKDGAKANIEKTMTGMRNFFTVPEKIAMRSANQARWDRNFSQTCLGLKMQE